MAKTTVKFVLETVKFEKTPHEENYYFFGGKTIGFKAGKRAWTWQILKNDFDRKVASAVIEAYCAALQAGQSRQELMVRV